MSRAARRRLEFYLAITPWLLGLVLFTGGPILASLYFSFTDWNVLTAPRWVGLDNYVQLATVDPIFWTSLYNTAFYTVGHVPLTFLVALLAALLLNQPVPLIPFFRTVFYLPTVTAGVALSILWLWIFNPEFGLVNYVLGLVGIPGPGWLSSKEWAKPALILMSAWGFGESMVILLAGLQGVPVHLYEAAKIDGANRLQEFRHVTLPMLSPVSFFVLIVSVIGSFQVFTNVYVMTKGGPADATLMYVLQMYFKAFSDLKMGYTSAMAWILFAIILAFTLLQFRFARRWVYYEGETRPGAEA
ncbi:MAG TPA: sugar ABC transporter permease [Chloroflexota bacterium]